MMYGIVLLKASVVLGDSRKGVESLWSAGAGQ
jgi:hypothetical protein